MKQLIARLICALRWHDLQPLSPNQHQCRRCGKVLTLREIIFAAGNVTFNARITKDKQPINQAALLNTARGEVLPYD